MYAPWRAHRRRHCGRRSARAQVEFKCSGRQDSGNRRQGLGDTNEAEWIPEAGSGARRAGPLGRERREQPDRRETGRLPKRLEEEDRGRADPHRARWTQAILPLRYREAKPFSRAGCAPGRKGRRRKGKRGWLRESSLWITRSLCCRHFSPLNGWRVWVEHLHHGTVSNDHRQLSAGGRYATLRRRSVPLPIHSSSISSDAGRCPGRPS